MRFLHYCIFYSKFRKLSQELQVHKLKELHLLSTGKDISSLARETVMRLASVSLAEVFIDIIPGYAIRSIIFYNFYFPFHIFNPFLSYKCNSSWTLLTNDFRFGNFRSHTEEELAQKLSKETKKLYDFEQTLLQYYLKYLQHLESYAGSK